MQCRHYIRVFFAGGTDVRWWAIGTRPSSRGKTWRTASMSLYVNRDVYTIGGFISHAFFDHPRMCSSSRIPKTTWSCGMWWKPVSQDTLVLVATTFEAMQEHCIKVLSLPQASWHSTFWHALSSLHSYLMPVNGQACIQIHQLYHLSSRPEDVFSGPLIYRVFGRKRQ
jgi:hypothetical protein